MEIASNSRAFTFPRRNKPTREVTHFIVTSSRLLFAEPQSSLHATAIAPLHEERTDDHALCGDEHDGRQERPQISAPRRQLAVQHEASGRELRFGDVPAAELNIIEHPPRR